MTKWDKWEKEIQEGSLKEREKGSSWMKSSALRWIVSNLTLLLCFSIGVKSVVNPLFEIHVKTA
jgi:hypothetical protein